MAISKPRALRTPTGVGVSECQTAAIFFGWIRHLKVLAKALGGVNLEGPPEALAKAGLSARKKATQRWGASNTETKLKEDGHHAEKGQIIAFAADIHRMAAAKLTEVARLKPSPRPTDDAWQHFAAVPLAEA